MTTAIREHRVRQTLVTGPKYLYVIILGLLVLGPLVALMARVFVGDGLATLFQYRNFPTILSNTVLLALGSLCIALVLGTALALAVNAAPVRWQGPLGMIPLVPMVVPGVADVTGWVFLLSPRAGYLNAWMRELPYFQGLSSGPINIFSFEWIVLLTGFSFTGFVYLYVSSSLSSIGNELIAAASVTGARRWRIFRTITLPLIRPALVYSSGIVLLLGLGQFTAPLILGSPNNIDVLSTILFKTKETYPVDYALGAAISAPLIIAGVLVMIIQKRVIGNEQKYTVITGKSATRMTKGTRWGALPVVVFGLIAVVLPIGALIMVAISPYWSANFSFANVTFAHIANIFTDSRTVTSLITTVQAIALTLVIVIPLGFMSALIQTGVLRVHGWAKSVTDMLTTLPLSMPAAILGFAMLYTYATPPFNLYGSIAIFVLAYVTLMIPHATRPQLTEMMTVGREFTEASFVSGASRLKTLFAIELPLYRKGISVAITMVVILLFHEFAASLMISTPGVQTIGALLYDYYTGGIYPQVAVIALLMVVVTFVGVSLSVLVGGKKVLAS